jgi:hypothetical protein
MAKRGVPVGDLDQLASDLARYREDPVAFVREVLNVSIVDDWQQDVLRELATPDRTKKIAMSACAGPGKTCLMAWVLLWYIAVQGDGTANLRGAAMSVTRENLYDNLWAEVHHWYNQSKFMQEMFDITSAGIFSKHHPKTWFVSTRSFGKAAKAEEQAAALSGLHAPYILFLIDESGDIDPAVGRKADQALGGVDWGRVLIAGNPTVETGLLYDAVTQREEWGVYEISADPDDPKRTPRVDPVWAARQIELYGRDDPWVMIYILGKFPPGGVNKLLSAEDVDAAMDRHLNPDAYERSQKRLGVDAARFGDDPWVIFPRQGRVAFPPVVVRNPRTHEIVRRVLQAKHKFGSEIEFFDDTGGWSVGAIDGMIEAGYNPVPVNFSSTKVRDDGFFNVRAEMYWNLAQWIKSGGCLPKDPELKEELLAPTYSFKGKKIILESKEQIKGRLGRSLDRADALAMTFFHPESSALNVRSNFSGQSKWDYDPIEEKTSKEV